MKNATVTNNLGARAWPLRTPIVPMACFIGVLLCKLAQGEPITGSNEFYQVYVEASPDVGVGLYTATTGPNHPAGSDLNVLFGGGQPGTTYNTIRSYTSATDYIQMLDASSVNTVVSLSPFGTVVALGTTGARTTYVLPGPPTTPDALTIIQDVNVNGVTFGNSTVEVTTKIINNGSAEVRVGIRYLWDFQIGEDDGPTFQEINPDGAVRTTEAEFLAPTFGSYQMTDNDVNPTPPTFNILGTVNGPPTVVPTPTVPGLLQYTSWFGSVGEAFDYTVNPLLDVATGTAGVNDSAVLYFFGQNDARAITIPSGGMQTVSASLFLTPPVPVFELALTPPTATNTVGDTHTVTARATSNINPVTNATVNITVSGANSASGSCETGPDGTCTFSYIGTIAGDDLISATANLGGEDKTATAVKTWLPPVPVFELALTPPTATNNVGQTHTVTTRVTSNTAPVNGATVNITVSGANSTSGSCETGPDGTCTFSYIGTSAGDDLITGMANLGGDDKTATAAKTWLPPAPVFELALTPPTATNNIGQTHTVTTRVTSNTAPVNGATVNITVSGANSGSGSCETGPDGTCTFSYIGTSAGDDLISAIANLGGEDKTATATKTWLPSGECTISGLSADRSVLWPPNHRWVDVTVNYNATGNCSADGCLLNVTSNEPVEGIGDGNTSSDWEVIDSHHVRLRAERSGNGDGRIYTIHVRCGAVGDSSSEVTVVVPKNQR